MRMSSRPPKGVQKQIPHHRASAVRNYTKCNYNIPGKRKVRRSTDAGSDAKKQETLSWRNRLQLQQIQQYVLIDNMPHSKTSMLPTKSSTIQQPLPMTYEEFADDFKGIVSDDPMEKDETEQELEKLVFGDDEGFHEGLRLYQEGALPLTFGAGVKDEQSSAQVEEEDEELQGVHDADVCCMMMQDNLKIRGSPER